jgi:hypothetical protein
MSQCEDVAVRGLMMITGFYIFTNTNIYTEY